MELSRLLPAFWTYVQPKPRQQLVLSTNLVCKCSTFHGSSAKDCHQTTSLCTISYLPKQLYWRPFTHGRNSVSFTTRPWTNYTGLFPWKGVSVTFSTKFNVGLIRSRPVTVLTSLHKFICFLFEKNIRDFGNLTSLGSKTMFSCRLMRA